MNIGLREASLNFELKENIGSEGRNSEVFIAHDKQFDADIVIKRIPKKEFKSPDDYYREAKCLYASKHQNIVAVNYSCEDDDFIYIAMPYYAKGSLQSILKNEFLTVGQIVKYSIDFISGVNHIHSKGLIHFDIKPTNILVGDSSEAMVTDFGLAKFTDGLRIAEQDRFYTLHIPPESLESNKFTIQADIYQVGLTLYRMCNGCGIWNEQAKRFNKDSIRQAIRSGVFPDRKYFLPHIPQKLRNIIRKALKVKPEDRYNNLIEMLNDLSKINENLCWVYTQINGENKWELLFENKTIDVTLKNINGDFTIKSYKTMLDSGRRTKETKNCIDKVERSKIDSSLKNILKSYN